MHAASDMDARWVFKLPVNHVNYTLEGAEGHYTQALAIAHYQGWPRWVVGGMAPFASVSQEGQGHPERNSGLGNPLVFAEYKVLSSPVETLALGSQFEIPWGDDEHGIAAEHAEWVPYISARRGDFYGRVGFRYALTSGHGHDAPAPGHSVLVVNPHEDKEFLYRVGWWGENPAWAVVPEAFLDGQHALDGEENKGKGYLTGGLGLSRDFAEGWSVGLTSEMPLVKPKRLDQRLGVRVEARF